MSHNIDLGSIVMEYKCPVGTKLKFKGEKRYFTVIAGNAFVSVCTQPFNLKKTVLYTVIDRGRGIRGTEDFIFCHGAETVEDCQAMVDRITNGESGVSERNWCKLEIESCVLPKGLFD